MYANYTRQISQELGQWLQDEDMQNRMIGFHIYQEDFVQAVEWGFTTIIIDDAPYLDSFLPQR